MIDSRGEMKEIVRPRILLNCQSRTWATEKFLSNFQDTSSGCEKKFIQRCTSRVFENNCQILLLNNRLLIFIFTRHISIEDAFEWFTASFYCFDMAKDLIWQGQEKKNKYVQNMTALYRPVECANFLWVTFVLSDQTVDFADIELTDSRCDIRILWFIEIL